MNVKSSICWRRDVCESKRPSRWKDPVAFKTGSSLLEWFPCFKLILLIVAVSELRRGLHSLVSPRVLRPIRSCVLSPSFSMMKAKLVFELRGTEPIVASSRGEAWREYVLVARRERAGVMITIISRPVLYCDYHSPPYWASLIQ